MTNSIGNGTLNLSINIPRDEHRQIARLAEALSQSVGDLIRRVTLKGFETELAQLESQLHREIGFVSKESEILLIRRVEALRQTVRSIRSAREKYYGAVLMVVLTLLIAAFLK